MCHTDASPPAGLSLWLFIDCLLTQHWLTASTDAWCRRAVCFTKARCLCYLTDMCNNDNNASPCCQETGACLQPVSQHVIVYCMSTTDPDIIQGWGILNINRIDRGCGPRFHKCQHTTVMTPLTSRPSCTMFILQLLEHRNVHNQSKQLTYPYYGKTNHSLRSTFSCSYVFLPTCNDWSIRLSYQKRGILFNCPPY